MRVLSTLDYSIIIGYIVLVFLIGLYFTRKASNSVEDFFIGSRGMPWWLIGVSMAATNFSIDTPIAVTKFVYKEGVGGAWFLWASAISALFVTFFFSKLWRRAKVLTDAEIIELRYSGKSATSLRLFKGFYFGVIFNAFIMGWVFLSLTKVMGGVTDMDITYLLWFAVILVFIYSISSGYYGVVVTDLFQYFIALAGSLLLAYLSLKEVGGLGELINFFSSGTAREQSMLNFVPDMKEDSALPFSVFLVSITMQWWAHKYSDGGGKHIQRMLSAKTEKDAYWGSGLYTFLTYVLQIWPWIVTALCAYMIFGNIPDPESAYPKMMAKVLPHGALGFVVVCLIGAFMSTIDTHMNLGASYMVNDIYKRFVNKDASQKHYVLVSRIMMGVLLLLAVIISKNLGSVGAAWKFLLTFASGAGLIWILRWFWWRINAWSEFSAMLTSGVVASILKVFYPDLIFSENLMITVSISAAVSLTVTFLTAPVSEEVLKEFVQRVRPIAFGWRKVYGEDNVSKDQQMGPAILNWIKGLIAFFSLNFGIGFLLFKSAILGMVLILVGFIFLFLISRGNEKL